MILSVILSAAISLELCANELKPYPVAVDAPAGVNLPNSYKPFYISHYGRHGSRPDDHPERFMRMYDVFHKSALEGNLTAKGDSLLQSLEFVLSYTEDHFELLTEYGVAQHKGIARRMTASFGKVFAGRNKMAVCRSTYYPRCVASMGAFVSVLAAEYPRLAINMDSRVDLKVLNYYTDVSSTEYLAKLYRQQRSDLPADTLAMVGSIFKDVPKARQHYCNAGRFLSDLYFGAAIPRNFGFDYDLFHYFTPGVLQALAKVHNDKLFRTRCNSRTWGAVNLAAAGGLVGDIVRCADEAIEGKKHVSDSFVDNAPMMPVAADLRFGHDGALLTLLCRFHHPSIPEGTDEGTDAGFRMAEVVPMGANLQLVFCRKKGDADEVYVLCLLNEKPFVPGGLTPNREGLCRWTDLKALLVH